MALLEEVKSLLTTGGISNIYIGNAPNDPNNVVCLYHSGGVSASLAGNYVREPLFLVRIRNSTYTGGIAIAESIKSILHGVNNTGNFLLIALDGDLNDIGRDQNDRQEWELYFRAYHKD